MGAISRLENTGQKDVIAYIELEEKLHKLAQSKDSFTEDQVEEAEGGENNKTVTTILNVESETGDSAYKKVVGLGIDVGVQTSLNLGKVDVEIQTNLTAVPLYPSTGTNTTTTTSSSQQTDAKIPLQHIEANVINIQ